MSANPFSPAGESAADLWLERSNLVGAVLGGVAYGVHVAVFAECIYRINPARGSAARSRSSGGSGRFQSWFLVGFIFLLFLMGTINLACNTKMNQLMFIDNRDFPGGPNAWFFTNYNSGINTAGNAAYIIANFLADGLLLWRTYVVWNSLWIIAFPFIVYLASTAMSILTLFQASRPDASLWTTVTIQFSLPYFSISIALNVLLTLLLVSRLFYMSVKARRTIGGEHGRTYISIAAMLLESAAPYAIVGLIFIITYARNSNVQNLVLPVLSQIMCISPEVIILRVAIGRATNSTVRTPEASMRFGNPNPSTMSSFPGSAKRADFSYGSGSTTIGSRPDLVTFKGDV